MAAELDLLPFALVYGGLAILAPLLAMMERRTPAVHLTRTRRGLRLDLAYWLITPIFTGSFARAFTLGVIGTLALVSGFGLHGTSFLARATAHSPFAKLPLLPAFFVALVVADFLGYLSHRLRHERAFWRVHAVHHATEELTAIAAARLHPLDEAVDSVLIGVPVLLLGFPLAVYAALGPFFVLHTLLLHANVPWTFGPLGRVFASPRFHRRHHARELPAANYGGVFAIYDVLFGTFDMAGAEPVLFGISERDVPETLWGQCVYPLKRALFEHDS